MRVDTPLVLFLITLSVMAGAHHLALSFYLYYIYPWFDIPMHLLGGVTVALGVQTALFRRYAPFFPTFGFFGTIAIVASVGVIWEVFEWYAGLVDSVRYIEDTSLDIVMDLVGGALGYVLATNMKQHDEL